MTPPRFAEATPQPRWETKVRAILRALVVAAAVVPVCALAAEETLLVELNTIESAETRCRLNFVIENKSSATLESMKLDLVLFGLDGSILLRLLTEMGPVRPAKTMVRSFQVDAECRQLGAILVNDVAACVPGEPAACLDGLGLSSRLKGVRLYK
jgi:hypothetical protein